MAETVLNRIISSRIKKGQQTQEHTLQMELPSDSTIEDIKKVLEEKLNGVISTEEIDKLAQNVLIKVQGAGGSNETEDHEISNIEPV